MCLAYQGGGNGPIKPYEVTTYEDFVRRSVVGDGIEGHEVWQHANLKAQGLATSRLSSEASKENIVIALPHSVHVDVNKAQRELDAKTSGPIDNIVANAEILYNNKDVPNSRVDEALSRALAHCKKTKK